MFGWLKKKVAEKSADAMANDILRFNSSLEGADDEEIATMLVVADIVRLNLMNSGTIPPAALNLKLPRDDRIAIQCDMCSIRLVSLIKQFQKMGQPSDATGNMIWLHSVRALNVLEIRALSRKMWGQLERGFPYVDVSLMNIQEKIGDQLPYDIFDELAFVPGGLEPKK